jgi:hypothetical protein
MATNAGALASTLAVALAAGRAEVLLAGELVLLVEDEELLPQPAVVKPIRAAHTAARARYRPIRVPSPISAVLATIVAVSGPTAQNSPTIVRTSKYRRGLSQGRAAIVINSSVKLLWSRNPRELWLYGCLKGTAGYREICFRAPDNQFG